MQPCNFWSVNKKFYRFCFLRWKSCTFARFKIWQCTGKCFHICWSVCCSRSNTLLCPEGSFLVPEIGILFGDAVGSPLFEAPGCHLAVAMSFVTLLYVADANNTIQESIWEGRQTSSQGGTRFRMLRAQFWSLAQSKYISEGTQKWTLLGSKVVPPGRPVFGPFILSDVPALQAAMCAKFQAWSYSHTNSIRGGNLELGRPVFTSLVFLAFKVQKTDPSFWQVEAKAVQTPPWTPELAQVHVTDPASPPCPPKQRSKC